MATTVKLGDWLVTVEMYNPPISFISYPWHEKKFLTLLEHALREASFAPSSPNEYVDREEISALADELHNQLSD